MGEDTIPPGLVGAHKLPIANLLVAPLYPLLAAFYNICGTEDANPYASKIPMIWSRVPIRGFSVVLTIASYFLS